MKANLKRISLRSSLLLLLAAGVTGCATTHEPGDSYRHKKAEQLILKNESFVNRHSN